MPRNRATAERLTPPEAPPKPSSGSVELEDTPEVLDEDVEDVETVIGQIDDAEATVTIKRRNPDDANEWDYLTRIPARQFSLEKIKAEFGGGEYRVTVADRRNRLVRGGPRIFRIDRSFRPLVVAAAPAVAPAAVASPEVAALRAELAAVRAKLDANTSTKEMFDMALRIATVMNGRAPAPGLGTSDVFRTATELIEFSKGLGGGGGGGGDGEGGAVRELVHAIVPILKDEAEKRLRRGKAPTAALPPGGTTVATTGTWTDYIRPYVPQLLGLAKENADPALYADVVYDLMERKMPAARLQEIAGAAQKDDFVDVVLAALPSQAGQYAPWFKELVTNLKQTLVAPPSPGDDDEDDEGGG